MNGLTKGAQPTYFGAHVPGVAGKQGDRLLVQVDNDGDAVTDVRQRLVFGKPKKGVQKFELAERRVHDPVRPRPHDGARREPRRRQPAAARRSAPASATTRSSSTCPGILNILTALDTDTANDAKSFIGCTSRSADFFAGLNVSSIVLEVPDGQLSAGAATTWASGRRRRSAASRSTGWDGPAIATVFIPNNPIPPDNAVTR